MTRILDIDLDLFLTDRQENADPNRRLDDLRFQPWERGEVEYFLEAQCGLIDRDPCEGRYLPSTTSYSPTFATRLQMAVSRRTSISCTPMRMRIWGSERDPFHSSCAIG